METASRETGTALYEAHQALLTQRERFAKNNSRLSGIVNKLEDESEAIKSESKCKENLPASYPGLVKDFNDDIDGYRNLNNELENLLDKLSRII